MYYATITGATFSIYVPVWLISVNKWDYGGFWGLLLGIPEHLQTFTNAGVKQRNAHTAATYVRNVIQKKFLICQHIKQVKFLTQSFIYVNKLLFLVQLSPECYFVVIVVTLAVFVFLNLSLHWFYNLLPGLQLKIGWLANTGTFTEMLINVCGLYKLINSLIN